jgi:hypothetical protein
MSRTEITVIMVLHPKLHILLLEKKKICLVGVDEVVFGITGLQIHSEMIH